MSVPTNSALDCAVDATPAPQDARSKIGVVICSQREPRAGDQIATFVLETLKEFQKTNPCPRPYELILLDLKDHPLPLYNEPGIPSQIHSASEYKYPHTRAWSELISSFHAFVFVTPQYNWGYPASIKNAIDYPFNEWKGKPALVVSYGGHGGGKAAAQLQQVLQGLDMQVVKDFVGLKFPDRPFLVKAARGHELGLQAATDEGHVEADAVVESVPGEGEKQKDAVWAKEAKEINAAFRELVALLNS